ncbi:MAG: c-type cytochrome [Thalassovita sp.]
MRHLRTLTVVASLCSSAALAEGFLPYQNPQAIAEGQELYMENCASCHGAALQGQENWRDRDDDGYLPAPPHDVTGHTWHHPDAQLFLITKHGTEAMVGSGYKSRMEGYEETLSDAQIVAVLAFIKSTWSQQVIKRHNMINANADQ